MSEQPKSTIETNVVQIARSLVATDRKYRFLCFTVSGVQYSLEVVLNSATDLNTGHTVEGAPQVGVYKPGEEHFH